jgi:hypothetical protein
MQQRIDEIKSMLNSRGEFARANRFMATINLPNAVMGNLNGALVSRDLAIMVDSVNLPGRNIATTEYTNGTGTKKMPYTFIDNEVNITFLLTQDYYAKHVFDAWMSQIVDVKNFVGGYKDDYAANKISIHQLDINNGKLYTAHLLKAYPISMGDIELSNEAENSIVKLQVTFSYNYYETEEGSGGQVPISRNLPNVVSGALPGLANNPVMSLIVPQFPRLASAVQGVQNAAGAIGAFQNSIGNIRSTANSFNFSSLDSGVNSAQGLLSGISSGINNGRNVVSSVRSALGSIFG